MDYYPAVEKFVVSAFTKANKTHELPHFERAVHWLLQLKPEAREELRIAAIAHDIERAFRDPIVEATVKQKNFQDDFFTKEHPAEGAEIIANFLEQQKAPPEFIRKVGSLIAAHEVGGDEEQNLIRDTDSVSFFENNADRFLKKYQAITKKRVKEKFQWMFGRITSARAKQIALPWYHQAMERLEQLPE